MLNLTFMLNKTFVIAVFAMGLLACEGEETTIPATTCGAGTFLNAAGDTCEANLSEGLSINAAGEIVADVAGAGTEAALAAAREEGRAEGVASVDITTDNSLCSLKRLTEDSQNASILTSLALLIDDLM